MHNLKTIFQVLNFIRISCVFNIIICSLILAANSTTFAQTQPSLNTTADFTDVITWVRQHAIPLKSVEPEIKGEDLASFGRIIGDAKIIGLGEATHGTREHYLVKSRIIQHLVEKKGFNLIAIEANPAAIRAINDYIVNGRGTAEEALTSVNTWVFATEEIVSLLKWLRQYNANSKQKRKVSVYGFDLLNLYPELNLALKFLEAKDPSGATRLKEPFTSLLQLDLNNIKNLQSVFDDLDERLSLEQSHQLVAAIEQVMDYYDTHRNALIKQGSETEWKDAKFHGVVALQRARNFAHVKQWFSSLGQEKETELVSRIPTAAAALLSFFEKYDSSFAETVRPLLTEIQRPYPTRNKYRNKMTTDERAVWEALADRMPARIQVRRLHYNITESILADMLKNTQDIRLLLAVYREYLTKSDGWIKDVRDSALAENIAWLAENVEENSKMIVWAHNGHISHFSEDAYRTRMGDKLKKRFGNQYLATGLLFNQGSFQAALVPSPPEGAPRIRPFTVGKALENSIENMFSRAGMPLFAVDLRALPTIGSITTWFSEAHPARDIGNRFSPENEQNYYSSLILPKHYDIVIYTDTTTRTRPIKSVVERFKIAP